MMKETKETRGLLSVRNGSTFKIATAALVTLAVSTLLFLLVFVSNRLPSQEVAQMRLPAPPIPEPVRACSAGRMCAEIVTGTYQATWIIVGAEGSLESISGLRRPTFAQKVLSRSATSVTVRVTSKAVVDTRAPFPLDTATLPSQVLPYLEPSESVQSDDPIIVEQAEVLVWAAQTEAQAVVAILDWVRANISYDHTFSLARDAISVYLNRSGVCEGFSNLAVALLRAAGIPARLSVGCGLWGSPQGGGHAWIEVYYPDVGWVPSEPQGEENFTSPNRVVSPTWWEWCGEPATHASTSTYVEGRLLYLPGTPYSDNIWGAVNSASVPAWDRHPVRAHPSQLTLMVSANDTGATASVEVESTHCFTSAWHIEPSVPWISVSPSCGVTRTKTLVSVNATDTLTIGLNSGWIIVNTPYSWPSYYSAFKTIPVEVRFVENIYRSYLPAVASATGS